MDKKTIISGVTSLDDLRDDNISTSSSETPLSSVINFRDISTLVNQTLNKEYISPRKFYRSARPDDANLQDRTYLHQVLGINTIIDLRTPTEHNHQNKKRLELVKSIKSESLPTSEPLLPLHIADINTIHISLTSSAYYRHLVLQFPWLVFLQFIFLYVLGDTIAAIRLVASYCMIPRGLPGIALDHLEVCKPEIYTVFKILADENSWPVLIHCTQGKDRTGLITQLVLMLAETDKKLILMDYLQTDEELTGTERQIMISELRKVGLPDDYVNCDETVVDMVYQHIQERYGNITQYLQSCRVDEVIQQKVKNNVIGYEW